MDLAEEKCLIPLYVTEGINFLSRRGGYTEDIQEALIFKDELDAHIYIDKHGLRRLSKVRKIVSFKNK